MIDRLEQFLVEAKQGKTIDTVVVRLVSGNEVRNDHVEFTLGGHQRVWKYIPEDEVWIEDGVRDDDLVATMCHELVERTVMKFKGWTYEQAHDLANEVEVAIRKRMEKAEK